MARLDGRVAIITGGAGGIGAATGRLFCEEGARVLLVDLDAEAMAPACGDIRKHVPGAQVSEIIVDVGVEESAAKIVSQAMRAFGRIDVLVNNAGIRSYEPLGEARRETWERILAVNLLSYAYLSRAALPALRASGRGSIVNVSSMHAFIPRAGMGQYDVTKAGIVSMTRTFAFEKARHGVRVNAVCPGATFTPLHAQIDGCRVQGVDGVRQLHPQVFLGAELPCLSDQSLREIGVDSPVAGFVGIGQRLASHRFAQAHVVELAGLRREADLDVAQTLPIG